MRFIEDRLDYTEDQREDLWYNRYEKQAMMEGSLKAAVDLSPSDYEARGLEAFTYEGSQSRRENRQRYVALILREQARQKMKQNQKDGNTTTTAAVDHCNDYWEVLASAAVHISRPCQERAIAVGHLDEVEVFPQWHLKLPPPTREEFTGQQPRRQRFSALLGWLRRPSQ